MPRTWSPLLDLHLADNLVSAAIVRELEEIGLEPNLLAFLAVIRDRGRITPTDLARAMGYSPSTSRDIVRQMMRNRHVRRVANPEDGRSHFLELTRAGEDFVDEAWAAVRVAERKLSIRERRLSRSLRQLYEDAFELVHGEALSVD